MTLSQRCRKAGFKSIKSCAEYMGYSEQGLRKLSVSTEVGKQKRLELIFLGLYAELMIDSMGDLNAFTKQAI